MNTFPRRPTSHCVVNYLTPWYIYSPICNDFNIVFTHVGPKLGEHVTKTDLPYIKLFLKKIINLKIKLQCF